MPVRPSLSFEESHPPAHPHARTVAFALRTLRDVLRSTVPASTASPMRDSSRPLASALVFASDPMIAVRVSRDGADGASPILLSLENGHSGLAAHRSCWRQHWGCSFIG